jgi:protein-serine/threonine kinase
LTNKRSSRVRKILEIVEKFKGLNNEVTVEDFGALSLLGKGVFGEVYLVKHKQTGNLYAMKVLDKKRVLTHNVIRYTRAERDVLSVTKHPFIVNLHYTFQNSKKLFMIMQYCPGYILIVIVVEIWVRCLHVRGR